MDPRPLRILEVISPSHFSGAERVVAYLSAEFTRLGHEVLVVTKPLPPLEEELARRGVPCRVEPISGKFNFWVGTGLRRTIREFRPDLVHSHLSTATRWATWAAHREGLPCVAHVHAMTQPLWYRSADLLLATSQGVEEYLHSMRFPPERVQMIYNGLDPAWFENLPAPEGLRAELGLPPGAPVLGMVAHLAPKKGHHVLLQALAHLSGTYPDLQCLMIGTGGLPGRRARLERMIHRLGLAGRVHLLGYRSDVLALTQLFDVAVLPSTRKEGLGLVLLEAAFLGIPAAGSDARGIREAVENGVTGLLAPPGDAVGLAEALDKLLGDPALRHRMGEAARVRVRERFTLRAQAEATLEAFRRVITR